MMMVPLPLSRRSVYPGFGTQISILADMFKAPQATDEFTARSRRKRPRLEEGEEQTAQPVTSQDPRVSRTDDDRSSARTEATGRHIRAPSRTSDSREDVPSGVSSTFGCLPNDYKPDSASNLFTPGMGANQGTMSIGTSHTSAFEGTSRDPYQNVAFGFPNLSGAGTAQIQLGGDDPLDFGFDINPPRNVAATPQAQQPYGLYPGPSSGYQPSMSLNSSFNTNTRVSHTTSLFGNAPFPSLPSSSTQPPPPPPRKPFDITQIGNRWRAQYAQTGQAG
ncbi:hypothetical protein LTS18_009712, partial [Coniosporium uncinatum]